MRGSISHLSVLSKRFVSVMRRCSPEIFLSLGRIYADVAPLEKRIDMHIDLLKREEFRAFECVTDINRHVFDRKKGRQVADCSTGWLLNLNIILRRS